MKTKRTYNPCDDCQHSYSKNGQESEMCRICEFAELVALKLARKEGKWKLHKDGSGTCNQCHFTQKNVWDYDGHQKFCGVCGARMTGDSE